MPKRRVLVSWIGHNDLRAMATSLPAKEREQLLADVRREPLPSGVGPIKTLVDQENFDEIFLVSNYGATWTKKYLKWLGANTKAIPADLKNPTDYHQIFTIVDAELAKLKKNGVLNDVELCIHLSPGSPAMTGIWLLLGKSRYPATFYQTFDGKSWVTEVPFDLVDDFAAEVFRDADTHLQHLMAESPSEIEGFDQVIGDSQPIRLAVGRAKRAAKRHFSILLLGESGTGKELFANAIHKFGSRKKKPFVPINCATVSPQFLQSQLFGHADGAYTGSKGARTGAFKQADGGTLFLDEVGECDDEMQAQLLRVLQPPPGKGPCYRVFNRLGDDKEQVSDVRIIAATNRDLMKAVNNGEFREDLFYRLANITIKLPPLRERKSDIPKIAQHLLDRVNKEITDADEPGYNHKKISDTAMKFVKQHYWPGNVRQLYNALIQAAVMAKGDELQTQDLKDALAEMPDVFREKQDLLQHPLGDGFKMDELLKNIQQHYLRRAMEQAHGTKAEAARLLGVSPETLRQQLERLKVTGNW